MNLLSNLLNPIFFLVFLFLSCSTQEQANLSKAKTTEAKLIKDASVSKNDDSNSFIIRAPRVDSVLSFNSVILSIFEDSKGNVWFGSWCDGLCKYDPSKTLKNGQKYFTYYTVKNGIPGREIDEYNNRKVPKGNAVRAIKEDKNGNIFIETLAGVAMFDGQHFSKIEPEQKSILITESFDASQQDWEEAWEKERNHLWFQDIHDNGVSRFDGQTLTHLTFPTSEKYDHGSFSHYATYSMYKDNNKNLWFGTEGSGIYRYDGKSIERINENEKKGIVRGFFQDASGKVWISNVLRGLHYYDHSAYLKGEQSFFNFTKEIGWYNLSEIREDGTLDDSKFLDGIQTIEQDSEGNLWFGSFSSGLWKYDGKEITHFNTENGLPSDTVKKIFKDKTGKLWFGIGRTPCRVYHLNGNEFERVGGK